MAALVYMLPESEFDEEAIVQMIEAIRPAKDEEPDEGEPAGQFPGRSPAQYPAQSAAQPDGQSKE
jgi:hypothetical protein